MLHCVIHGRELGAEFVIETGVSVSTVEDYSIKDQGYIESRKL